MRLRNDILIWPKKQCKRSVIIDTWIALNRLPMYLSENLEIKFVSPRLLQFKLQRSRLGSTESPVRSVSVADRIQLHVKVVAQAKWYITKHIPNVVRSKRGSDRKVTRWVRCIPNRLTIPSILLPFTANRVHAAARFNCALSRRP
jgi:hypothetical protein